MQRIAQFMHQERLANDRLTAFGYFARTFLVGGLGVAVSRWVQIEDKHSYPELMAENIQNWAASWLSSISPTPKVLLIEEAHHYVEEMNDLLLRLQSNDPSASSSPPTASTEVIQLLGLDAQSTSNFNPVKEEPTISGIFSQDYTTTTAISSPN